MNEFWKIAPLCVALMSCDGLLSPSEREVRDLVPPAFHIAKTIEFTSNSTCFSAEFEIADEPAVSAEHYEEAAARLARLLPFSQRPTEYRTLSLAHRQFMAFRDTSLFRVLETIGNRDPLSDVAMEVVGTTLDECWRPSDRATGGHRAEDHWTLISQTKSIVLLTGPKSRKLAIGVYANGKLLVFGTGI